MKYVFHYALMPNLERKYYVSVSARRNGILCFVSDFFSAKSFEDVRETAINYLKVYKQVPLDEEVEI